MEKKEIWELAGRLWNEIPGNILSEEMEIRPEYIGIPMWAEPIIGFGSAEDPLFAEYKKPGVIGPWHRSPKEWLPEARTVISFFFPAGKEVRETNRKEKEHSSVLWSYARIEGQAFITAFMEAVAGWFREQGYAACVPSSDERFQSVVGGKGISGYPEITEETYGSTWSERHAAYACGMGTFALSKGLITARGIAGRYGSVIVSAEFAPDPRPYTGIYDYCIRCGACIRRCPANAIDLANGKDHTKCAPYVSWTRTVLAPRFGCGLCQTGVPCEMQIPNPAFRKTGDRA
ncbi:MAG: 4Fe-4S binding protein [Clostridia bacterium]|nr:4Fe-4S binding protein [Clostridia bacterium]